ncbi:MAG: hypothetical protein R6V07_16850 [Armatimonadota bacterium]
MRSGCDLRVRYALLTLALLAAAGAVSAQERTPPPTPRAAVFAFMEPQETPDRLIGRRASDAVWTALEAQSPWELVDPGWLLRLCESEEARPPFAVGYLQMLGHRADAPLAVTGSVESFTVNRDRGVAQVTLSVELVETLGGTRIARSRGVASARRESGEVLGQAVDRALMEAGADAVRDLTSFDPLSAVVVATLPDGRVMMDGPREDRIRPGSKLLIYRRTRTGAEAIGTVDVKTSRLTALHAEPIAGEDFRQGDRGVVVAR